MITIESESLRQLTFDIYRETGAPEDIARVVSDYQVDTNLWGHDSHGCIAVPRFVNDVHSWPFKAESKIEAGRMDVNPERFDVGELVTSVCDMVSPLIQEGVELKQDVTDGGIDKARVQQMVINLLSNAIKFTESGSVTVKAEQSDGQLVVFKNDFW